MNIQSTERPAAKTIGRFELIKRLGRGAQAEVWLAFDPRLERQVALKLLHSTTPFSPNSLPACLEEARNISQVLHSNVVTLFEADIHDNRPFLVLEYVEGETLTDYLRRKGPLGSTQAALMMSGILKGLSAAHALGVIHLDLKPSNIMVTEQGEARVMDFGIAERKRAPADLTSSGPQKLSGTPNYMAPEATAGAPPHCSMDIFSAGLVFAEMLTARPVIEESDPYRAIYKIAHEPIVWPDPQAPEIDDGLRSLVHRCLHKEAFERWQSVDEFEAALRTWLEPQNPNQSNAGGSNATLEFLLRRMRYRSDFPTLSNSVSRIQHLTQTENEDLRTLAAEILKDVALTQKLLRWVNTARYAHSGSGGVSTVSRAVALVGLSGIRNMAISLTLLEHMEDKAQAAELKEEFLSMVFAGSIASELSASQRESEESFIGAMLHNLGRLLTNFYLHDDAKRITNLLEQKNLTVLMKATLLNKF
jgi:eukaryotic-like serine/threonine-protein kinase